MPLNIEISAEQDRIFLGMIGEYGPSRMKVKEKELTKVAGSERLA